MKNLLTTLCIALGLIMSQQTLSAQETYGRTLNLGLGIGGHSGYTRYASRALPVVNLNYEFDIARNFTIAPFISLYTYNNNFDSNSGKFGYKETVIPVGAKGTYYFDEMLGASSRWDFYGAASAGFAIVRSRWDDGYSGNRKHFNNRSPVFFDLHLGAEYHFTEKIGMYLDLSSGISTIGVAFH